MEPKTMVVQVLGGFRVTYGSAVLRSLPRQSASLLAYLLLNRERPHTRDLLAGRFWSDLPDDKARRRLSNTLWQIRNAFQESGIPDVIEASTAAVELSSQINLSVDSEVFLERLDEFDQYRRSPYAQSRAAERLANVLATYPGDFMAGYYDEWIEPEQYRIRERYLDALRQLVRLYKSSSDYESALRYARDLVAEEPLSEEAHREVMRLYAMLGRASAAENQYDTCREILQLELGFSVSDETVELIHQIRQESQQSQAHGERGVEVSVLIGRSEQRIALLDQADALIRGRGAVVLVEGEAGMGKTHLLDDFARSAQWRDLRLLRAGHNQFSNLKAYDGLREALEPSTTGLRGAHLSEVLEPVWLAQAAEVFPNLRSRLPEPVPSFHIRPEEEPTRMSEALVRVLLAQGGLGPTVIILEDVHLADDDSLFALSHLGDRIERSGVLLVLSYRRREALGSDTVWSALTRLERSTRTVRISLGPLSRAEMRELIAANPVSATLSEALVDYLVAASNGNPLSAVEDLGNPQVLQSLADELAQGRDPLVDRPSSGGVLNLATRTDGLPETYLRTLRSLAVLAEPATVRTLSEIAGLTTMEVLSALTSAVDRELVVELDEGLVEFTREQVRRGIYDDIPGELRRELHDRSFQHLAAGLRPEPEQLAYHAAQGCRWPDAYRWHLKAADRALDLHAYRTSAEHYTQADFAADEAGIELQDRVEVLLSHEAAADILGSRDTQARLLAKLSGLTLEPSQDLEVSVRRAELLSQTNQPEEAVELLKTALRRAEKAGLNVHRIVVCMARLRLRFGDPGRAIKWAVKAQASADSDAGLIDAEIILAMALNSDHRYGESEEHARHALEMAKAANDRRNQVEALGAWAANALRLGRFGETEELLSEALEQSRTIGYRYGEGSNLVNLATVNAAQGRGGRAIELFDEAAEVFQALDNRRGEIYVGINLAELEMVLLGDYERAAGRLRAAIDYFRSVGDRRHERKALAWLAAAECRMDRRRLGQRRLRRLLRSGLDEDPSAEVLVQRLLARDRFDGGDFAQAVEYLERVAAVLADHPDPMTEPNVDAMLALLVMESGDQDRAIELARRAVKANDAASLEAHVTALWACQVFAEAGLEPEADAQALSAYRFLTTSLQGLDAQRSEKAWSEVSVHSQITEAYERRFSVTRQVRLPVADAPGGRPLAPDEYKTVSWTLSEPSDWLIDSATERRRNRIRRLIREAENHGAIARIADLANALGVSERTIKRDMAKIRLNVHSS